MHLIVRSLDARQRQLLADIGGISRHSELGVFSNMHRCALVLMREQHLWADEIDMESHIRLEEVRKLLPDVRR